MKILTIGGATQDITFHTKEGVLVNNPEDILRQQLLGFEFGAKLNIKQANFTFGGGAVNTAVNLANLGNAVSTLICVGDDTVGQEIIKNLKEHKIKTNLIQTSEKNSGLSFVINAKNLDQEHVLFTYRGANESLKIDLDELIKNYKFDLIYLASLSGTNAKNNLAKIFRYKNNKLVKTKIAWNPGNLQIKLGLAGLKPYLNATDIFIVNKDEAIEICATDKSEINIRQRRTSLGLEKIVNPRDLLRALTKECPGIVVITDGDNGAYAFYKKKIYFEPAIKIKEKDTTGVGDAFGSTFAWAIEYTCGNIQKSLEMAVKNASAVIQQVGAQNGLLSKTKLMER